MTAAALLWIFMAGTTPATAADFHAVGVRAARDGESARARWAFLHAAALRPDWELPRRNEKTLVRLLGIPPGLDAEEDPLWAWSHSRIFPLLHWLWALLAAAGGLYACLPRRRRWTVVALILFSTLGASPFILPRMAHARPGVIRVQTSVRAEEEREILPAGVKVMVLERRYDRVRIRWGSGEGWVEAGDVLPW